MTETKSKNTRLAGRELVGASRVVSCEIKEWLGCVVGVVRWSKSNVSWLSGRGTENSVGWGLCCSADDN